MSEVRHTFQELITAILNKFVNTCVPTMCVISHMALYNLLLSYAPRFLSMSRVLEHGGTRFDLQVRNAMKVGVLSSSR